MSIEIATIRTIIDFASSKTSTLQETSKIDEAAQILKKVIQETEIQTLMREGVKSIILKELNDTERKVIRQAEKLLFPKTRTLKALIDILPESNDPFHPLYKWHQRRLALSVQEIDFWIDLLNSGIDSNEISRELQNTCLIGGLISCYLASLSQENKLNPLFKILIQTEPRLILEKESNGKNVVENALLNNDIELAGYLLQRFNCEQFFTSDGCPILSELCYPEHQNLLLLVLEKYPKELLYRHLEVMAYRNPFIVVKVLQHIPFAEKNLEKLARTACDTYVFLIENLTTLTYLPNILHRDLGIDLNVFHLPKEVQDDLSKRIDGCKNKYRELFLLKSSGKAHFQNKLSKINFMQVRATIEAKLGALASESYAIPHYLHSSKFIHSLENARTFLRYSPPYVEGVLKEITLGPMDLKDIIKKVLGDKTKSFGIYPVLTGNHMMLLIKQGNTYRLFDPNYGIIASKDIEILSGFASHYINKNYFNVGDLWPNWDGLNVEQHTFLFNNLLAYPEGICAGWCLDFAEQLTNKHREGILKDEIHLEDFSYECFGIRQNHLKEGRELFDRGHFQKALELFKVIDAKEEIVLCEGKLLYLKNDFEGAINKFKEIDKRPEIDLCAGFIALSNYDYEKAKEHFSKCPDTKASIQGIKICELFQSSKITEKDIEDILKFFISFKFEEKPHFLYFRVLEEGQKRFPNISNVYLKNSKKETAPPEEDHPDASSQKYYVAIFDYNLAK